MKQLITIMSGDLTFLDDNLINQLLGNCDQENFVANNHFNGNHSIGFTIGQNKEDEEEDENDESNVNNQTNSIIFTDPNNSNQPHNIIIINSSIDKTCLMDSYDNCSSSPNQLINPLAPGFGIHQDSQDDLIDHEYETDYSVYENKSGLAEDMKFLASMPELCDVTFLVGETREPVCAVRSVLAARSRTFHKLLYAHKQNQLSVLSTVTNNVQQNNGTSNNNGNNNTGNNNNINSSNNNSSTVNSNNSGYALGNLSSVISSREGDSGETHISNDSQREKQLKYSKSKKFRETSKETKLKLFLKRSSEPALNGLPVNHSHHHQLTVQSHRTMIIEEFEPDVFRQLIEYIHTGCVTLQARTLLGLLNAADYYGLEELRRACLGFVSCCITVDTVCALLASAERYIQYKCTKSLVQRVLEFVDQHGNDVLCLGSFALLPEHVVRLILSREELKADELTKFHAALSWSQRYCDASPGSTDLREVMSGFFECIEFYKIPATVLMREVHPLGVVPDHVIMNALAFQADPRSVDLHKIESPNRFRRMTLPHALNIAGSDLLGLQQQSARSERSASTSTSGYISNSDLNHITVNGLRNELIGKKEGKETDKPAIESNKGSSSGTGSVSTSSVASTSANISVSGSSNGNGKDGKDEKAKSKPKEKDKSWRDKIGKRKARPFRRAKTLLDSN